MNRCWWSLRIITQLLPFIAAAVATMMILVVAGCTKSEVELRNEDRAKIERIITEDMKASNAMAEADEAARHGNVTGAIDAVEQKAKPAIELGLAQAAGEQKTAWGKSQRDVLAKILSDRKAELGPYSEAVKSKDPQKMLDSMEAQVKIERRAIAAVATVRSEQP